MMDGEMGCCDMVMRVETGDDEYGGDNEGDRGDGVWIAFRSKFEQLKEIGAKCLGLGGSHRVLEIAMGLANLSGVEMLKVQNGVESCRQLRVGSYGPSEFRRMKVIFSYQVIVFGVDEKLRCDVVGVVESAFSEYSPVVYEGVECRAIGPNSRYYVLEVRLRVGKRPKSLDAISSIIKARCPNVQVVIWRGLLNNIRRKLFIFYLDSEIEKLGNGNLVTTDVAQIRHFLNNAGDGKTREELVKLSEEIVNCGHYQVLVYDPNCMEAWNPASQYTKLFDSFVPDSQCITIHINCKVFDVFHDCKVHWNVATGKAAAEVNFQNVYNVIDSACYDLFALIGEFGFEYPRVPPFSSTVVLTRHGLKGLVEIMKRVEGEGRRWRIMQARATGVGDGFCVDFAICDNTMMDDGSSIGKYDRYTLTVFGQKMNWDCLIFIFGVIIRFSRCVLPYLFVKSLSGIWGSCRDAMELFLMCDEDCFDEMAREFGRIESTIGLQCVLQRETKSRRCKRLATFDMDSTLIRQECIDEMAKLCGFGKQVSDITNESMGGKLNFEKSLAIRLSFFKDLNLVGTFERIHANLLYTRGVFYLVDVFAKLGVNMAIITGGFTQIAGFVAKMLGINQFHANTLHLDESGRLIGSLKPHTKIVDPKEKAKKLIEMAERENLKLEFSLAIGDGANDIPMLNTAGLGIAFNAKPVVKSSVKYFVDHPNISTVLFFLGISTIDSTELILE